MVTRFFPSTCYCVLDIPVDPYRENKAEFVQQCEAHNNPNQTFAHNRTFKKRPAENLEDFIQRTRSEKAKPQFRRRN